MSDEAFTEIANAMLTLRIALKKHNIEPPHSMEMRSRKDFDRLSYLAREHSLMTADMGNVGPVVKLNICGFDIAAPANIRAEERGGYSFV